MTSLAPVPRLVEQFERGLDAVDQRQLPGAALDLPDAERDQNCKGGEREDRDPQAWTRRFAARPVCLAGHGPAIAHFIPLIWWMGIMLLLRWFITHSEPDSAITTMTMVKISAIMLQPFSDFVFMCRK